VHAATWTERYAYDAAGALTERHWEPAPAAAPAADQDDARRAHGPAQVHYEHDAQGRVVVRRRKRLSRKPDVWRYTWDSEDRLVAVVTPDGARWQYRYDPYGRRIAKERLAPDGSGVVEQTMFAWDGFVLAEQTTRAADGSAHCPWTAGRRCCGRAASRSTRPPGGSSPSSAGSPSR
jgi:YD repeat-containing protein